MSPAPTEVAVEALVDKFDKPAEALVAAHFLLRFLPEKLPQAWASNLLKAAPDAADGPVIAAWRRILMPPSSAEEIDKEIDALVEIALARQVTLFARTRLLLAELIAMSDNRASSNARHEAFRRFGAAAGGFESFWGASPDAPGTAPYFIPPSPPRPLLQAVTLELSDRPRFHQPA